jgi:hypothetical protein
LVDFCDLKGSHLKSDQGGEIDGFSIRPFLRDPDFSDWDGPDGAFTCLGVGVDKEDVSKQTYAYRTRDWRYVLYADGSEELYNHQDDPYEWTNLAEEEAHAETKQELRDQLMAIIYAE